MAVPIKLTGTPVNFEILRLKILLFILFFALQAKGQRTIPTSDTLRITGKIKREQLFSAIDLDTFPKTAVADLVIYNHKGEIKDTLQKIKGVLLKDILNKIEYVYDKPRELNEFYFIFTATDNYKVVFSWNEIYNTGTGNHFYIITELNSKKTVEMEQRILFLSTADLNSGRRYIKGLQNIEVRKIE